jgi:hypothetical protein
MTSKAIECAREADVIDAVTTGCFDDELRAHLSHCVICADLAAVTAAIQEEHAAARAEVRIPAPGLLWWRMELRARHEAARTAARPIALAQAIAAICGVVVATLLFATAWPFVAPWIGGAQITAALTAMLQSSADSPVPVATIRWVVPIVFAIVTWIVVAPLAIYFVFSDD